ncbi:MAG TPA: enoyl-CoA hydratase-related protein, partial [Thermomicrobiales bacterium]|nr:enoyl-CoA hydratase-related protein [Thermomicrobiales bacterium]
RAAGRGRPRSPGVSGGVAEPFATIRLDWRDDGRVAIVTLDRPAARNAIDRRMAAELALACNLLSGADSLRAAILTGAGERAFCAGADLRERVGLTADERTAHTVAIEAAAEAVAALPMPTIAAIRGYALAGGAELAIACDLRVAADDAVFGFPEVRVGIFPGAGGAIRLPALVGLGAARDLLFTGRQIDAQSAVRIGLVDRAAPAETIVDVAVTLAREIAANAPLAVRAVKQALAVSVGRPPAEARAPVNALRATLDGTEDYAEGLRAFAERRSPEFRGR